MGFVPQQTAAFCDRAGFDPSAYIGCVSFEEFYAVFLDNLTNVVDAHIAERNRTEAEGVCFNPCQVSGLLNLRSKSVNRSSVKSNSFTFIPVIRSIVSCACLTQLCTGCLRGLLWVRICASPDRRYPAPTQPLLQSVAAQVVVNNCWQTQPLHYSQQ